MRFVFDKYSLTFASFFALVASQSRWVDQDNIPAELPEGDFLAVLSKDQLKDAARETAIWKLDLHEKWEILESFYRRRSERDFDGDEEDKRT